MRTPGDIQPACQSSRKKQISTRRHAGTIDLAVENLLVVQAAEQFVQLVHERVALCSRRGGTIRNGCVSKPANPVTQCILYQVDVTDGELKGFLMLGHDVLL